MFSLIFTRILFPGLFVCRRPLDQTKNDRDARLRTHTPLDYLKAVFCFFRRSNPEGCWLRKTAVSHVFHVHLLDCLVILFIQATTIFKLPVHRRTGPVRNSFIRCYVRASVPDPQIKQKTAEI